MANLHKLYYKEYYQGVDFNLIKPNNDLSSDVKERGLVALESNLKQGVNDELLKARLVHIEAPQAVNCSFQMQVQYPGLVTGIGINHDIGIKGEFKLGVNFDYTSGMPIIYGATVKGVLKSHLEMWRGAEELAEFGVRDDNFEAVVENIFGEDVGAKVKRSIYDRDIFFDAVIVEPSKGRILSSDAITPHKDNPLKNPIPIIFLKIASGAVLEFRFKLTEYGGVDKKGLFSFLLSELGVGAKTNVGYGQLVALDQINKE